MQKTSKLKKSLKEELLHLRINYISIGTLLVMLSVFILFRESLPQQAWLVGLGLIIISMSAIRLLLHIHKIKNEISGMIVGSYAIFLGITNVYELEIIDSIPIILVVAGVAMIFKAILQMYRK